MKLYNTPAAHLGMTYWREAYDQQGKEEAMIIGDDDLNVVATLPAECGELGAKIWIEGFVKGQKVGARWGRAQKLQEILNVLERDK